MECSDTGFVAGACTYLIGCDEMDDFAISACQFKMSPASKGVAVFVDDPANDMVLSQY
jgi:hypothetical protein